MNSIEIKNKNLINLLNDYSDWFEQVDKSLIKVRGETICSILLNNIILSGANSE